MADERDATFGVSCEHGQLARSCERCEDAAEISQLRAQVAALTQRAEKAEARAASLLEQRNRLSDDILRAADVQQDLMRDLAISREQRDEQSTLRLHVIERAEKAERERDEARAERLEGFRAEMADFHLNEFYSPQAQAAAIRELARRAMGET
jgi:hypothetical protein